VGHPVVVGQNSDCICTNYYKRHHSHTM